MTPELKEYLEYYIDDIETGNFQTFYSGLNNHLRGECTEVLYAAGINPLENMHRVPAAMFQNTKNIFDVEVPAHCLSIDQDAFKFSRVRSVNLNDGLVIIDSQAFSFCHDLREIIIPDTVHTLGDNAFLDCTALEHIKLSQNLHSIDVFTFMQCHKLSNLSIPVSVVDIHNSAFNKCYDLKELHYEGNKLQWSRVHKHYNWTQGSSIVKIICTDGEVYL